MRHSIRSLLGRSLRTVQSPRRLRVEELERRDTPTPMASTLYVNDNWVDVNGGSLVAGDTVTSTEPGAPVSAIFGTNAFKTINSAIAAATPYATVQVLQGTYTENVTIDKPLALLGAQNGVAVGGRTIGGAAESVIVAPDKIVTGKTSTTNTNDVIRILADDVIVDGFTVSGNTKSVAGISNTPVTGSPFDAHYLTISNDFIRNAIDDISLATLSSAYVQNNSIEVAKNGIGIQVASQTGNSSAAVYVIANTVYAAAGVIAKGDQYCPAICRITTAV